jgi:hypothetical protein
MTDVEVTDARRGPRFLLEPPIEGAFNGDGVSIYNLGENGIQFEHRTAIAPGTHGELRFSLPHSPRVIRFFGRVTWCRMAKKPGSRVAWPYRCGVRIEGLHALTLDMLAKLLRAKLIRPDLDSLERKRKLAGNRTATKRPTTSVVPFEAPLTLEECINRVQTARARLAADPQLMRSSVVEGRAAWSGEAESEEIIATWQFLGGSVSPDLVAMVFDLYPSL